MLWDNAQWTLFSAIAVIIGLRALWTASPTERPVRLGVAAATLSWFGGQIAWDIQVVAGWAVVPAPSDLLFLSTLVPAAWAIDHAVRDHVDGRSRASVYLDALVVLLATATTLTLAFGQFVISSSPLTTLFLLGLPVGFLALSGAGLVGSLAAKADPRAGGLYGIVAGTALLGAAYLPWVADAPAIPDPGSITNLLFSAGITTLALGGASYRDGSTRRSNERAPQSVFLDALPLVAVGSALVCLIIAAGGAESAAFVQPLGWLVVATATVRQVLLTRERAAATARANAAATELRLAERRHRRLIEQIPATVYIDERAAGGDGLSRLLFISPQIVRLVGHEPDRLQASADGWYQLIHPDDAAEVAAAEDRHFLSGEPLDQTFRMRAHDGREVWVRDEANLVVLPDGRRRSHGVLIDVTAQRLAEEQVRASEEQQRQIIDTASSAYISIDLGGDVLEWNERAASTFGWSRSEAIGRRLSDLIVPPGQRAAHQAGLQRFAEQGGGPLVGGRVEVQAMDRSGRIFPVELSVWPVRVGPDLRFSALVHDITERRRLEDELRHQAFHDSLTGLANRALFSDRLSHTLERREARAAVLYFDIDDFKSVNDGLGHATGDALLVEIAQRLAECLRPGDTAARLGGDEFAILLEDASREDATRLAERIVGMFVEPFKVGDHRIAAQASIGVALGSQDMTADRLMRDADVSMYEAKRGGKGTWQVYDPSMSRTTADSIALRADLKQAIAAGQIRVVYQPIVDLETRATVAVEALARWTHPSRGEVPPTTFIPLAESFDLISALGMQVLREACAAIQQVRATAGGRDVRLTVNLSARQLLDPSIVTDVRSVLVQSGLEPAALTLEITEGVVVDDTGRSISSIADLKRLGVRIAIDDFGTGYSSLSYLSRLPVDVLKIDRSFVADMERSRQATALVRSIIRIAQTLHLETVAEGVETEAQAAQLVRHGARLGQGYLFARPMGLADLVGALDRSLPTPVSRAATVSAPVPARR